MNVGMVKLKENRLYVYYKFTTEVWESINSKYEIFTKVGYCKFNKQTEEFEPDLDKTDPYFLDKGTREVLMVKVKLIRIKRAQEEFPEKTGVATG